MGRNHCRSGVAAGLVCAAALPAPLLVRLLVVVVVGGAALVPDIDCPSATAARSLGFITKGIAKLTDSLSLEIYYATREERDVGERKSGHRLATHTLPGALLYGVAVAIPSFLHPIAGGVVVLFLARLLGLSLKGVGSVFALLSGGVAWWVLTYESAWWWAIPLSSLVGCVVHIFGDWLTNSGVPLLFPLVREGKRWGLVSSPLPFAAGDHIENAIVAPLLLLAMAAGGALLTYVSLSPLLSGAA